MMLPQENRTWSSHPSCHMRVKRPSRVIRLLRSSHVHANLPFHPLRPPHRSLFMRPGVTAADGVDGIEMHATVAPLTNGKAEQWKAHPRSATVDPWVFWDGEDLAGFYTAWSLTTLWLTELSRMSQSTNVE